MILGHIENMEHGGPLAIPIRLGPLLAMALFLVWCAVVRNQPDRQARLGAGAALVLGAAGAIHLALAPEHAAESVAAGVFFVVVGVGQLVLGWLVATGRAGRWALVALLGLTAGLFVLYVASRAATLPGLQREAIDAVGLLSKFLELAGAALALAALTGRPRRVDVDIISGLAATTLVAAVLARPVFGLGPRPAQLAAAIFAAVAATVALDGPSRPGGLRAVADASVLSLLIRTGGLGPFLVGGAASALFRVAARRLRLPVVAPLALSALVMLALPGSRFEILHVSHPGEAWSALLGVVVAVGLALCAWGAGTLPAAVAFLATHVVGQGLRLLAGRTGLGAVEVPAASLGLFLVATVVLADPEATGGRRRAAMAAGLLAGGLDVVLRDRGVPYPALFGVAVGVAVVGAFEHLGRRRRNRSAGAVHAEPTQAASPS